MILMEVGKGKGERVIQEKNEQESKKRFYTRGTLRSIMIPRLAKISRKGIII